MAYGADFEKSFIFNKLLLFKEAKTSVKPHTDFCKTPHGLL